MKKVLAVLGIFMIVGVIRVDAEKLIIASYNVRYHNTSDSVNGNGWKQRCPVICSLIRFNNFEVFGAQEVLNDQLGDMLRELPEYDYVGVGRDDGKTKGEYAPVFFQKDKFERLNSGNFWLAENTDEPNIGWDAALPRICTWVNLKRKDSDFEFFFFNLHMDHVGVEARKNSAKLVIKKIKQICGDKPVILTGDFNVDQNSQNYKILKNSGVIYDSYELAEIKYALNGTFNDFKINRKTNSRIDHVFISENFKVDRYGILTDTYRVAKGKRDSEKSKNFPKEVSLQKYKARIPSDHYPVKVVVRYNE